MPAAQAPVLFVSHGAPTFALEPGLLGPQLQAIGRTLGDIRAVLVVSPHWQTRGEVCVMATAQPETIHDFGGFAAELYTLQYPAPGAPDVAEQALALLRTGGFPTGLDARRGLDHGAWVPLLHLLPAARVPVFQVSLPFGLTAEQSLALGHALAPLRTQGVLILGSGSMTHNLHELAAPGSSAEPYALEFAAWVRTAVQAHARAALCRYRAKAPFAQRAHPTEEHFLPLLVAVGATGDAETPRVLDGGIDFGVLSMESYAWGLSAA